MRMKKGNTPHGLTRRDFLKGTAAGAVILGINSLTGCTAKAASGGSSTTASGTTTDDGGITDANVASSAAIDSLMDLVSETVEADVVVLGSGGCGCAAAARAAQLGMKTILLEKNAATGGTTLYTEGLFAVESHWQEEAGIEYTVGEVFSIAMDYHHWLADGELNHSFIEASAANLDWMEEVGIKFKEVTGMGTSLNTWHLYETEEDTISGAKYVKMWKAAAENQGAEIMLSTPGRELVIEDGKAAGMIAEKEDGSYFYIKAPVVILATGGYADNADMINELCDFDADRIEAMGSPGRDGDGITMARDAGALLARAPGTLIFYGGTMRGMAYGTELYCATAFQPFFWVNDKAKRFTNEELSEQNFTHSGNAQCMQKKVFSILTKAQLDMFAEEGCVFGCGEYISRGTKLTNLWEQLDDWLDSGNGSIYTGETLSDLAKETGLDEKTLTETVNRYNELCEKGQDEDYNKNPDYLYPLESGPYYAFELVSGIFATGGGLKINTNSQVIGSDEEPIPGLYAGGCETGGLYGDTYDVGYLAGSCQGFAIHTGKTAADHALLYLGM